MSGIGKSELTHKFCHKIMNERKCRLIRLNGHSPQYLHQSVFRLCYSIGGIQLPQKTKPRDAVTMLEDAIIRYGESKCTILLLIENVNDVAASESVKSLFTETVKNNCFVMVNSNAKNVSVFDIPGQVLPLDLLQSSDSENIIRNALQSSVPLSLAGVENLTKLLQNFPLVLGLATAYIRMQKKEDTNYEVRNYIEEFESYEAETMITAAIEHEFITLTVTALNISIRKIKQSGEIGILAIELINIMAYCEPEEIPVTLLCRLNGHNHPLKIYDALVLAYDYGLVDGDQVAFRINRLLQSIVRSEMHSSDNEVEFLRKIVRTINDDIYSVLNAIIDMNHVQSIWSYAANYPLLIKEFDKFSDSIGDRLYDLLMYKSYMDFSIKYEARLAEILGPDHLQTMTMESQVAYSLWNNGKFDESLAKHKTAIAKQRRILGEYNELTMITLNNTALVFSSLGKLDDELEIFNSLWNLKKTHLGDEHPETLQSMERYIESLWKHGAYEIPRNMNDFGTALELYERLVNLQERVLAEDHVSIMRTKLNWANKCCGIDRPDRTVQLKREVLAAKERVFGPQHPETIQLRNDIDQFLAFFRGHRLLANEAQPE